MTAKRLDNPQAETFRLGDRARAALDALQAKINADTLRPVTRGEVVERAILALAKRLRVTITS